MDLVTLVSTLGFSEYAGAASAIVAICSVLSTLLSAPDASANSVYKFLYALVNMLAFNVGKAKNADDVAQKLKTSLDK